MFLPFFPFRWDHLFLVLQIPTRSLPTWKQILRKKVDLEQNSAFNMYDIVFTDLIETFVLPNTRIC